MSVQRLLWVMLALLALVYAGCGSGSKHHGKRGSHTATTATGSATRSARRSASESFTPAPRAVAIAGTLPLARQVAQLFMVTLNGTSPSAVNALGTTDWGGVVFDSSNFSSDSQVGQMATSLTSRGRSPDHLEPLIAATQEGGSNTAFADLPPEGEPSVGATGQPSVANDQATAAATALLKLGFNMTLAPLADVDTPGGPLTGRLFSDDPGTVASLTVAAVRAYNSAGLISAVGHFPGSGAASGDPDQMTAGVGGSLEQLQTRDLVPFAAVAPLAPVIVMSNASYAAFDGVTPAGLLPQAVNLLRAGYGFQGVVMSDDLDATLQSTGEDPGQVAVQALEAGDDLLYISGGASEQQAAYSAVLSQAQSSGHIRGLVYEALLHVLSLKVRYGVVR